MGGFEIARSECPAVLEGAEQAQRFAVGSSTDLAGARRPVETIRFVFQLSLLLQLMRGEPGEIAVLISMSPQPSLGLQASYRRILRLGIW